MPDKSADSDEYESVLGCDVPGHPNNYEHQHDKRQEPVYFLATVLSLDVFVVQSALNVGGYALVKPGEVPPWMAKVGTACTHCGQAFIRGDRAEHTHRYTDPPLSDVYVVAAHMDQGGES